MGHQEFVDTCAMPCAVLSVEKDVDGSCGEIRIACANQPYKDQMGPAYYDGMPYDELVPKDLKFEDFCFRAAHKGERMHAYVQTKALGTWTDQIMIPLEPANDHLGYCQFIFEFTQTADPARLASVSMDTAAVVIKACMTLAGAQTFKEGVANVLEDIRHVADALCCRILLVDHQQRHTEVFCERLRGGVVPEGMPGQAQISYETTQTWDAMIGVSNAIIIKGEHDYAYLEQCNPAWIRELRAYGVSSLVLVPLRRETTIGYLYVTDFDVHHVVEVKEIMELLSYFMGAEIENHLLMRRMEKLSTIDALTGLQNRNAMISRMHDLPSGAVGCPFGVINLDLNGLKQENDEHGHDAGDRLLVSAAELLRKLFYEGDIYRTGGDEFIVLVVNIEQSVFAEKVARLRETIYKHKYVHLAVGSYWSDGTDDLRHAFHLADERMYADKRAYYAAHPHLSRR